MLELAQIALLDHTVHILAIVLVNGREVLLDADRFVEYELSSHEDSIPRF
jgi:hypothetical protein